MDILEASSKVMEYPKIHSLYKRQFTETDPKTGEVRFMDKGKSGNPLIIGDYACEEFAAVNRWTVTEKVDGTNIRIIYKDGKVTFGGRTENAQIPCHLFTYLQETFGDWNLSKVFPCAENKPYPTVILFGEGYGHKIQSGGYYRTDAAFILFDVFVDSWWLKREDIALLAIQFGIQKVPLLYNENKSSYIWSIEDVVGFVKSGPLSTIANVQAHVMEGIVARSEPQMLCRGSKQPIMFKLKTKDFK